MRNSKYWIDRLQLVEHPSGAGYFKAIYQSNEEIKKIIFPQDLVVIGCFVLVSIIFWRQDKCHRYTE